MGEKKASPRWVKEVRKAVHAGDIDKADRISKAMSGHKAREVLKLPSGLDARPSLMTGKIPGSAEKPGLWVAKFTGEASGVNPVKDMKDRALTHKILGSDFAKTYGRHVHPSGKGGVSFQEYLPYGTTPDVRKAIEKKTKGSGKHWLNRTLWDVADHHGNVRLSREGVPKILDARFDKGPGGSARRVGTSIREREGLVRRAGASALRSAQEGSSKEVHAPSWARENLPIAASKVLPYAPAVLGAGLTGYGLYRGYKKDRAEQKRKKMEEKVAFTPALTLKALNSKHPTIRKIGKHWARVLASPSLQHAGGDIARAANMGGGMDWHWPAADLAQRAIEGGAKYVPKPAALKRLMEEKNAAKLTAKGRNQIAEGNFALPDRRYPIHDASHARNALARVSQHGTPGEKKMVRSAVAAKYPSINKEAVGTELEIAGAGAKKLGLPGADALKRLAKHAPDVLHKMLMWEPPQPSALKGKHFPGYRTAAKAIAHEPVLGAIMAAPTGPPGPMSYLGLRGLAGKAVGVPGTHLPHESVPGASRLRKLMGHTKTNSALKPFVSRERRKALEKTDTHFEREDRNKWDDFLESSKRKSFVRSVQGDPRADDKLHRHVDQMNRHSMGKKVGKVGKYDIVRKRGGGLSCSCPDWRYRKSVAPKGSQDCKHIKAYKANKMQYKRASVAEAYKEAGFVQSAKEVLTGSRVRGAIEEGKKHKESVRNLTERLENLAGRGTTLRGDATVNRLFGSRRQKRLSKDLGVAQNALHDARSTRNLEGLKTVGAHAAWAVPTALAARHLYKKRQESKKEADATEHVRPLLQGSPGVGTLLSSAHGILTDPEARRHAKKMFQEFTRNPKWRQAHPDLHKLVPKDPLSLGAFAKARLAGKLVSNPKLRESAQSAGKKLLKEVPAS